MAASLNFCSRCGAPLSFGAVDGEDRDRLACTACGHIAYVNPRLVVTTFPITDAGEIVLIRRGIEPGKGSWAQPGGFLEVDETVHEAAIRETLRGDRPARRARRDRRAVHAARGERRHHRLRGPDRRRHRGARPPRRPRSSPTHRRTSRGRTSRSRRPAGRSTTGWSGATPTCRARPRTSTAAPDRASHTSAADRRQVRVADRSHDSRDDPDREDDARQQSVGAAR